MVSRRVLFRAVTRALCLGAGVAATCLAGCNPEEGSIPKFSKSKAEILKERLEASKQSEAGKKKRGRVKGG